MRLFKKGEKELQMIFGLFILLIISLVVLSLFFKFTEKSSGQLEGASTEYFTEAQKDKAIQECYLLCDQITDDNTLIEFCGKTQKIDWNGDRTLGNRIRWGKWEFCEDQIPCFVLVDSCQEGLNDASRCKQILQNPDYNSMDVYNRISNGPASGQCGKLCSTTPNFNSPNIDGTFCASPECDANWRCKFGFFNSNVP